MRWLLDPRDPHALDARVEDVLAHLRRHASDPGVADSEADGVRALLAGAAAPVDVDLDWASERPTLRLLDASTAVLAEHTLDVPRPAERDIDVDPDRFDAVPDIAELTSREGYLAAVSASLCAAAAAQGPATDEDAAAAVGAGLGRVVFDERVAPRGVVPDLRTVVDAFVELENVAGGRFEVTRDDGEEIEVVGTRCPFGDSVHRAPGLCRTTSATLGSMAARVTGEATVVLDERIALGDDRCRLLVRADAAAADEVSHHYTWPPERGLRREGEGASSSPFHLSLTLRLPRDELSVPVVRRLCSSSMRSVGVMDETVRDVELAITEACANVIEHSGEGDAYDVRVVLSEQQCAIDVIDRGRGFDADVHVPVTSPGAESGRGVALMQALVDRVQFASEPREGFLVHMVKALDFDAQHPIQQAWRNRPGDEHDRGAGDIAEDLRAGLRADRREDRETR